MGVSKNSLSPCWYSLSYNKLAKEERNTQMGQLEEQVNGLWEWRPDARKLFGRCSWLNMISTVLFIMLQTLLHLWMIMQ